MTRSSILKWLKKITGSTSQKQKSLKASWYVGILRKTSPILDLVFLGASRGSWALTCLLQELVEYYQAHSLKESFKQLDTTLKYPYKSRERSASRTLARSPGKDSLRPAGGHRADGELAKGAPPFCSHKWKPCGCMAGTPRLPLEGPGPTSGFLKVCLAGREVQQSKDSCYGDGAPPNLSRPNTPWLFTQSNSHSGSAQQGPSLTRGGQWLLFNQWVGGKCFQQTSSFPSPQQPNSPQQGGAPPLFLSGSSSVFLPAEGTQGSISSSLESQKYQRNS